MNTPVVGTIYHVVNKIGEVIKVGSTVHTVRRRSTNYDYRKKYKDCVLLEFKTIKSSELDWYDRKDPYCPFLWHLVASEHLEILRANTFRKSVRSNKLSPLDQKFFGFEGTYNLSRLGAMNQKREDKARGGLKQGPIQGKRNVESGLLASIYAAGGRASGKSKSLAKMAANAKNGERFGRWSVESGHLASLRTPEHQRKASYAGVHSRCHVKRGIVDSKCFLCTERKQHGSTVQHSEVGSS